MTAKKYLKEHGINKESIELFGITSDKNYLHIPIKDEDGEDLFIKSRNLNYTPDGEEPKYKNSAGSHATLFNLNSVMDESNIVLAEGEIDAIKLMQEGIPAISSTGGSGTFPEEFAEVLKDKKIWICYDNDPAGIKGVHAVLEYLPHARVMTLPKDSKDICDFFTSGHKLKEFIKLMKLAQSRIEWKASHIPEEHTLYSGDDIMNMEIKLLPWLIDSVVYEEGFCFIYGAENTGKSFLTLSMAQAIATGEPWLDTFDVPNKTNVLFLDKENPLSLTVKRVHHLGGVTDNVHWLKYPHPFSLHDGKGGVSEFALDVAMLVEEKNIGLVIIDSFVDLMVGSANSAEDTQQFFSALKQIFPGVAFLVIHHENKPAQGTFRTSSQRVRGSSNINAQTETMFRIEAVAKSKTEMTLEQTKIRDEQKMDKFMIRMEIEPDPHPEREGKTIVTGFEYVGIVISEDTKSTEAEELIKSALADSINASLSRQDLIAFASEGGISESTFNRVIKEMETEKTVVKSKKGRAVWFSLDDLIVGDVKGEEMMI